MTTERIPLDGVWEFLLDPNGAQNAAQKAGQNAAGAPLWRDAIVPMPWQAQFDDLREASGAALYKRTFSLNDAVDPGREAAILHFGAVDYFATVWVNGQLVGEHEGGYLPFELDVTHNVRRGNNDLVVRAVDANDDRSLYPDHPFSEVPHGKQSWYGPISGIWQSVWLEVRPRLHIRSVRLTPSVADAAVAVSVELSQPLPADAELAASVRAPDGNLVAEVVLERDGTGAVRLPGAPALWSPESPNLYEVECILLHAGEEMDRRSYTCGFRTIAAHDGRIYLNDEPIYLRGALDQSYFPETIYTPPSLEYLELQARKAKALGLNCLRIHIKVEDPRYYEVADRLGLIVWTEIPNWALLTDETDRRARETFRGIVERDGNHPSICIWTLINENWGTDLPRNPDHRRWLRDFYAWAKTIDSTRLIVDNSACINNFHVAGDLEDFHMYKAIPDHADEWDAWVEDYASRNNDWVWAGDYQDERRPDLPLIVSEFGNWGLPDPATLNEHGGEPWWFETGYNWGDGMVYPHGIARRFVDSGLSRLYTSYADFARNSQEHMARSLHYEITTMRLNQSVAGYVITEFTDVNWECNGLMTMQREVKHGLDTWLTPLNQDRAVLLRPSRWSALPGESVDVQVRTSGVVGHESSGVVRWSLGDERGEIAAPGGTVQVAVKEAGVHLLHAEWLVDGAVVATGQVELTATAPTGSSAPLHVVDDEDLAAALGNLGYTVAQGPVASASGSAIVVARRFTASLRAHVQQGGRALVLADEAGAANGEPAVELPVGFIVPRQRSPWEGDWATSFAWLRKQGPLSHLPGDPLLEMEYAEIMPDSVIVGLPNWVIPAHSWGGLAVGWVHKVVSLLVEMPYGRGQFAVTTFKLNAATLATDAVAQALFSGILALL